MDKKFFQGVSDLSPFRQGDVIRSHRTDANPKGLTRWGVIITADCDIAQGKSGDLLSYLPILSARDYLQTLWANEEIEKIVRRYGSIASGHIHRAASALNPQTKPLLPSELIDWSFVDGAEKVVATVGIKKQSDLKATITALKILALCHPDCISATPLESLISCWRVEGRNEADQRGMVRSALRQSQMRSEFLLIPTLPNETEVGFIVTLRDIRTIGLSEIFPNKLDLRIKSGSQNAMFRIGRFSDFIRYSIAQRMANLFSRIGMTVEFEDECEQSTSLVCESILSEITIRREESPDAV